MPRGKHGTRLNGLPSDADMREARRQLRRLGYWGTLSITETADEADVWAYQIVLDQIAAALPLSPMRGEPDHLAQQIGIRTLLQKRLKAHHLVGHRRILGSVDGPTETLSKTCDDHRCG